MKVALVSRTISLQPSDFVVLTRTYISLVKSTIQNMSFNTAKESFGRIKNLTVKNITNTPVVYKIKLGGVQTAQYVKLERAWLMIIN